MREPPTQREIRIAIFLTAILLFAKVLQQVVTLEARRADFGILYGGALIVRQGNGSKLYDVEEQRRVQETLFGRGGLIVLHPPFEALLLAPLTRLSYLHAYVVWGAINATLWMLFTYLIRPHAPVPEQTFRYFMLCFGFYPLWVALIQGQTSVLLLVLYSLTFLSLKRKQDFRAGVFLGLGLFKFQLVLPFALICVLRRKWRLMGGFAAAALLLGALSAIAVGPAGVVSYVKFLIDTIRHPANPTYTSIVLSDMPTLQGFFTFLMTGTIAAKWINAAVALVSVFLILFTAWWWHREDQREGDASLGPVFAIALVITLLTGSHVLVHDLSLMLLAVLLTIGSSQRSEPSGWRLVLNASIVPLYLPPVFWVLFHWNRVCLLFPVLVAFVLAAFCLARKQPFRPAD